MKRLIAQVTEDLRQMQDEEGRQAVYERLEAQAGGFKDAAELGRVGLRSPAKVVGQARVTVVLDEVADEEADKVTDELKAVYSFTVHDDTVDEQLEARFYMSTDLRVEV